MRVLIAGCLALAACSGPKDAPQGGNVVPRPTPSAAATAPAQVLVGRWKGVEGMYLQVSPGAGPGRYRLEMQYDLDHRGVFEGVAGPDGVTFVRDGKQEVLRPTDGDATGLKYLAGKSDCLTVTPGEGYCRD